MQTQTSMPAVQAEVTYKDAPTASSTVASPLTALLEQTMQITHHEPSKPFHRRVSGVHTDRVRQPQKMIPWCTWFNSPCGFTSCSHNKLVPENRK